MPVSVRGFMLLPMVILWFGAAPAAHAASSAEVIQTHPAANATLGHQENFWIRIAHTTDEPISLWVRPYLHGVQVRKVLSNASLSYVGSGEALGWFALTGTGDVDEVRIMAGGGKPFREWELSRHPVRLHWTDGPDSAGPAPQWVEELLAVEKARYAEDAARRASEPVPAGDVTLFSGFMLVIVALLVAGIVIPLRSAWKWRGGWKIAAAVPVCVMGFVVLRIIVDTARDPTSHNLWPFEILTTGVIALACIGALKLARRFMGAET